MGINWNKNNQVVRWKSEWDWWGKPPEVVEVLILGPGKNETLFNGIVVYSENSQFKLGDVSDTWVKCHFKLKK